MSDTKPILFVFNTATAVKTFSKSLVESLLKDEGDSVIIFSEKKQLTVVDGAVVASEI